MHSQFQNLKVENLQKHISNRNLEEVIEDVKFASPYIQPFEFQRFQSIYNLYQLHDHLTVQNSLVSNQVSRTN